MGNEVYDWTRDNLDDNDDVISALKGLDREVCLDDGMEMAAIPEWLRRSMEKTKQMIEVQPIDDIDDYLARSAKKEPKRAEILSHIARDETEIRIAQIVVTIAGVTADIATLWISRSLQSPLVIHPQGRNSRRLVTTSRQSIQG